MKQLCIALLTLSTIVFAGCEKCWKCSLKDSNGNVMKYEDVGLTTSTGEMFVNTCDEKVKNQFQGKQTTFKDTAGVTIAVGTYDCVEE